MAESERPTPLEYADPETNRFRVPLDSAAKMSLIAGMLFFLTPVPAVIAVELDLLGIV